MTRFSETWPAVELASLSGAIVRAIESLADIAVNREVDVVRFNESYAAARLAVEVALPSRGPVNELDVRQFEPILILFDRQEYPYKAPKARSDRRDFPADRLPHLNPVSPGQPYSFCLHRGPLDNWFAEHTIQDFVGRVQAWLRDAARDRLMRDDDAFEPTRLDTLIGMSVFDYEGLTQALYPGNSTARGSRPLAFEILSQHETSFTIRHWLTPTPDTTNRIVRLARLGNELADDHPDIKKTTFGILAWPTKSTIVEKYFGSLPDTWEGLTSWAEQIDVDLSTPIASLSQDNLNLLKGVPLIVAIPRPRRLIGQSSDVELLSFVVLAENWLDRAEGGRLPDPQSPVFLLAHRQPNSPVEAARVSGVERFERRVVFVGTGALGSKVAMHLARAGASNFVLVDPDTLSPHNLTRHALTGRFVGKTKVEGLQHEVKSLYQDNIASMHVEAMHTTAFANAVEFLPGDLVLDSTASLAVLNWLSDSVPDDIRAMRAEIASDGQLGLVLVEGDSRNPRLDDMRSILFDSAIELPVLSSWLHNELARRGDEPALEEIPIGLGCSSNTLRLADDLVSFHASVAARSVRDLSRSESGYIQLSWFQTSTGQGNVHRIAVDDFLSQRPKNDPEWEVRISEPARRLMAEHLHAARPRETGGLLLGRISVSRKKIWVTRALPPSRDSRGTPWGFRRGIEDVPSSLQEIAEATGGQITYCGEWHTHPFGGSEPSPTDLEAASEIRANLDRVGLPTHILIVTPRLLSPYVFGSH